MNDLFEILHEDDDLLVINKPAGLVCHPTKGDERSSLAGRLRLYRGAEQSVHLINRLDRETSGVVCVGKTDEAARELRRLWESREVEKHYWAIVHGHVAESEGTIDAPLGSDDASEVAVKDCVRDDGILRKRGTGLNGNSRVMVKNSRGCAWHRSPAGSIRFASISSTSATRLWATSFMGWMNRGI